jgi:transposase-like protein
MAQTDFVECPKCRSKTWVDNIALGDEKDPMRFHCKRCNYLIKLGACRNCRHSNWERRNEVHEKGGRQPVVRYRCRSCGRVIGLFLDTNPR